MRPVLFNIFISDMDTGIEFTLSKLGDDTTLVGALSTLEEREVIQRDQDRLEMWACVKLMKFTRPSSTSCTRARTIPGAKRGWMPNDQPCQEVLGGIHG